jgi:magnesium-protoporphyrin IX monomethyl ester (oxidative) cyclase
MKILFVNPPVPQDYYNKEVYLPSSLLYLSAVLQKNGEEIKILDLKCPKYANQDNPQKHYEDVLIDTISSFQPELIGFGCLFSGNFPELLKLSIVSKKKFDKIPIIIGGIHPTIYAKEILTNCPSIDYIILGEGEESIVQFINTIKTNCPDFEKIDGFAYRMNGRVVVNPKKHFIEDSDTIPFPAYNLIDLKDYYVDTSNWHNPKKLPINTSVPIISSRSCPNRCNFCSMFLAMGPRWRPRSPKNVVDEIEHVYHKYNHRHFAFMDDNFSLNKSRVLEICNQIIERNLDIQFETPNGLAIATLDEEVLDALVSAGMVRTYLAIESGSDFIRNKIMRKNLRREKIYEIVKLIRKYKQLNAAAFFIMGMPEETRETLMDTYTMIEDIEVDRIFLMNIVPFPGTEVFEQALRDNLLVDTDINNLYLVGNRYLTNYNRFFLKPYKLDIKDLQEFRAKCEKLMAVKKSISR